jgi:hypothetical protein
MAEKKTLQITPDKKFPSLLRINFKEGGAVPEELSGMYSSRKDANVAVEAYKLKVANRKVYPRAPAEPKQEPVEDTKVEESKPETEPAPVAKKAPAKKKTAVKRSVETNAEEQNAG